MYFEIYGLAPDRFFPHQHQHCIDIDILLMVEKSIRGGICHAIHRYATTYNKYTKGYDKNKKALYLMYWDANIFYGWALPQMLLLVGSKWVEELPQFNKDF